MRKTPILLAAAVIATLVQAVPQPSTPVLAATPLASADYIITFAPGASASSRALDAARIGKSRARKVFSHAISGAVMNLTPSGVAALRRHQGVVAVELDAPVFASATQTSPTWGLDRIDQTSLPLSNSYTTTSSGSGVDAYIVDTGIRSDHTEFQGRTKAGFSAVTDANGTTDCNGHGTHVAGTVGGTTYGVAKSVSLIPVRVLDCAGSGTSSGVVAGLDWIVAQHAAGVPAVANMSLGGSASAAIDAAVQRVIADGVTVVVAAGNSNVDACTSSPARVATALTVGATTSTDARASYSNFGSCLDIFAPGSSITSAWSTSASATNSISGTSMASPHVAGAAALLLSTNPSLTPASVATALTTAATPNVVTSSGSSSPNRLLFVGNAVPPTTTTTPPTTTPTTTTTTTTVAPSTTTTTTTLPPTTTSTLAPTTTTTVAPPTTTLPPTSGTPSTPKNIKASPGKRSAIVRWEASSSAGSPLRSYVIAVFQGKTRVAVLQIPPSFTAVQITGLAPRVSYQFSLRATNSAGSSPESARTSPITAQ